MLLFAFHFIFLFIHAEELPAEAEDDEEKKLLSDVVAKDLDWHLFNITAAEYRGHNLQIETEKLAYFIPSRLPPSFASKIEENTAPRFEKNYYKFYCLQKNFFCTRLKSDIFRGI